MEYLERLNLDVSTSALYEHLVSQVLKIPITIQWGNMTKDQRWTFGCWSVLSSNGTVEDGCEQGEQNCRLYDRPTEICTGYLETVIKKIKDLGLSPCRARITNLKPKSKTIWHKDISSGHYKVRLHIPIQTHELCKFSYGDFSFHMPTDGAAYLVRVDQNHEAYNDSNIDRYHLIMDVFDTKKITKNFHFHPNNPQFSVYD
jgi:hypothetical protein